MLVTQVARLAKGGSYGVIACADGNIRSPAWLGILDSP